MYRDFRDIESFKEEIEALLEPREPDKSDENQLTFLDETGDPLLRPKRRRGRPRKVGGPSVVRTVRRMEAAPILCRLSLSGDLSSG